MGKLNYTNRKVEGIKLGQIVAKDLMKRIPPGSATKAALRDPYVELDVSGKRLTDSGFAELALSLISSTTFESEHGKAVRVEELCLADNSLTAKSLQALGSVLHLAANDLRDLDLSGNDITVTGDEEAFAWAEFLTSFRRCSVLSRVDFSGNALGPRAFEIFARVYGQEELLDFLTVEVAETIGLQDDLADSGAARVHSSSVDLDRRTGTMRIASEPESNTNVTIVDAKEASITRRGSQKDSSALDTVLARPVHASPLSSIYAAARGLRSIPYIIFADTSMRDTCALHLSYILANHSLPDQLLPYLPAAKAGPLTQQLEAYNTISACQGIIYLPNDKLSSAGIKVLELSELAREGWLDESTQGGQSPSETPYKADNYPRRVSDASFSPASGQAQGRRRSTMSTGSVDHGAYAGGGSYATTELDRARSRIQGNTLKECGVQSVELWSASLRMLSIARQILPVGRREQSDGRNITLGDGSVDLTLARPTYASKLMLGPSIPGEPILAITGMSTHPTTPTVMHKRKGSSVATSASMGQSPSLSSSLQTNPLSVMIKNSSEDVPMPFGLPEALWQRIIALASGAIGVVNTGQQGSIIRWAKDRDTLSRERETLGKSESTQIWRVLDGMGCLAYEVRS